MLSERRQERETLVRELEILPPCTDPDCPDHSSPVQAEIDEKNTVKIFQAADSLKQRKIIEKKNKAQRTQGKSG
ncbi:hypothetical protein TNCV_2846791 [Trichonephila clavipes]|nr:hypothetical protein TNCV_2846791 [Trichonephila clavipes]